MKAAKTIRKSLFQRGKFKLVGGLVSLPWCVMLAADVCGQTTEWTNGSGFFHSSINWDNGVPNSSKHAIFGGSGGTITFGAPAFSRGFTLRDDSIGGFDQLFTFNLGNSTYDARGATSRITTAGELNDSSLVVSNGTMLTDLLLVGDGNGNRALLSVNAGATINSSSFAAGSNSSIGNVFVRDGGELNIAGNALFGGANGAGNLRLINGGRVNVEGLLDFGLGASASSATTIENSNGNANILSSFRGQLAGVAGGVANLDIQGNGRWNVTENLTIGGISVAGGDGTLTVNGNSGTTNLEVGGELKIFNSAGSSLVMSKGNIRAGSFARLGTLSWTGGKIAVDGGLFNNNSNSLLLNSSSGSALADQVHLVLENNATTTGVTSIVVGATQRGSLSLLSGATLSSSSGNVGFNGGGTGTATINGGHWNMTGQLAVGSGGTGTATITNGGTVSSSNGQIGNLDGSSGSVSVSSALSNWTMTGALDVASGGQGTLSVVAGAQVNSSTGSIGLNSTGVGSVTLNGSNSNWNSNNVTIGGSGNGTLNIAGGRGLFDVVSIAASVGGTGNLNQTSGSLQTDALFVGGTSAAAGGTGKLSLSGGNAVNNGELKIWNSAGSNLTLDGGSLTTNSLTRLGGLNLNNGSLRIVNGVLDNGTSSTNLSVNGGDSNDSISVSLEGAATSTSDIANLSVGSVGAGTVRVRQGATMTSTSATIGGGLAGFVDVADSGSTWSSGAITANTSLSPFNDIRATNGGVINSSTVNLAGGSLGFVSGNGSVWNTTGAMNVGTTGDSELFVDAGGRVDTGVISLGTTATGNGEIILRTAGSIIDAAGVNVGTSGSGLITIDGGADLVAGFFNAGNNAGGSGVANISGAGTTVNTGGLSFGFNSAGQLNLSTGAVISSGNGTLGGNTSGIGVANVNGAGTQWNVAGGDLLVGNSGNGTVNVNGTGRVAHTGVRVGNIAGSTGNISIDGLGSQITGSGLTIVGGGGTGTINVSDGGKYVGGITTMGSVATGNGTVNLTGTGSSWQTNGLFVGGSTTVAGGAAAANINAGSSLTAFGTIKIWEPGRLNVSGGTVVSAGLDRRGILAFDDGSFEVRTGTFNNNGGNFSLGGASADQHALFQLNNNSHGTNFNILSVGASTRGTLELNAGSDLAASVVTVGQSTGGNGTLRLNGSASISASSFMTLGTAGNGSLILENGSSASVSGNLNLNVGGLLRLDAGTVNLGTTLNFNGGQFDWRSGTVNFSNAANLSAAPLTSLLGAPHQIAAGRTLSGTSLTLSSQTSLVGGNLTGANLIVNSTLQANQGIVNASNMLTINSGRSMFVRDTAEVNATAGILNNGSFVLDENFVATGGGMLENNGTIRGSGIVGNAIENNTFGRIQVTSGQLLEMGRVRNAGEISIVGGEAVFADTVDNSPDTSIITARDGIMRFNQGLNNEGGLAFTFGTSDVFGKVVNDSVGIINVSGGGNVTFYDDVRQNGTMQIAAVGNSVSTAVAFGSFSGSGGFIGGGDLYALGDLRPGNSPASVLFGGNLFLGSSTDTFIELGGLSVGDFDQMLVTGDLSLAGRLFVSMIDGFSLGANEQFLIGDVGDVLSGQFFGLSEGSLVGNFGGQNLFITYGAGNGNDIGLFTTAIPEPGSGLILVGLITGLSFHRRRRTSQGVYCQTKSSPA